MADEKPELRDFSFRQFFPWTDLFRSFQIALDPKKLFLAGLGILAMAVGWWLLALLFSPSKAPTWDPSKYTNWNSFKDDREAWNVRHAAAGDPNALMEFTDAGDLANDPKEYAEIKEEIDKEIGRLRDARKTVGRITAANGKTYDLAAKPAGALNTWPWFEDRGPNPYLIVTGQTGKPWETGRFGDWLLTHQVPVLLEPLFKFLYPVVKFLSPGTGTINRIYFFLVIFWTLAVWALFGGAITRMASVQVARNDKIGVREALRFVWARYTSFLTAPVFPLVFVGFMVLLLSIYGGIFMIPWLGDIVVAGIFWPLVLLAGLAMAVVLVGLVGWPMMYATISAEGSDSFDAISRSYSYVYQNPWNYAWYSIVSIAYGAVVVFFIGFMGSAIVYLGKWGVSCTPGIEKFDRSREPSFLFVHAPTSFGWRTLLLDGAKVEGVNVVQNGSINLDAYNKFTTKEMSTVNHIGAYMVSFWLWGFFLLILGFSYSYFWSASTIIYLLMRRKVDDTDMDEIYLEEDEEEEPYSTAPAGSATTGLPVISNNSPVTASVTMVDAPKLRTNLPTTPPQTASSAPAADGEPKPHGGDGASS